MADWIRVDKRTADGLKVRDMATFCTLSPTAVLGGLVKVWIWFDDHAEEGWMGGATVDLVNDLGEHQDFGYAMEKVGLLNIMPNGLKIPAPAKPLAVKKNLKTPSQRREADRQRQAAYRAKKRKV